MADHDTPSIPLAASSNMTMGTSAASTTSQKPGEMTTNSPIQRQDALRKMAMKSRTARSKDSLHGETTLTAEAFASGQPMAGVHHDRIGSREKALDMQRVQLADQLSDKHKLCTMLEVRLATLQDELVRIKSSNEALEAECAGLHGQIDEASQRLEAQTNEAEQRDKAMLEKVHDLESRLETSAKALERNEVIAKTNEKAIRDTLSELDEAKHTISDMAKSHESRERDLHQRLAVKGAEARKLKQTISTLQAVCADAASKKEAAEKEVHAQAFEKQQKLEEARDQTMDECRNLRASLDKLQESINPFSQVVVIGVDVSGSVAAVLHEIKQACRDVLHVVKSNNSHARVAVIIHGSLTPREPSPVQTITDATFRIMDSVDSTGGGEDYIYCLEQAREVLKMYAGSEKLIMLIGDGNACGLDTADISGICEQFRSERILVHSIVMRGGPSYFPCDDSTIQDISYITGGRIQYEDTYLAALDELFHHERERHFNPSQ